jgi:peptide deformylase
MQTEARILDVTVDRHVLKTPSLPIGAPDGRIRELARDMLATMYASKGVGLAAVQVGEHVRLLVMDAGGPERPMPIAMVDPVITWSKKRQVEDEEGCLSIPGRRVVVSRPSDVTVAYTDLDGVRLEKSLGGWPARIVQHEIDHLDGKLITDMT